MLEIETSNKVTVKLIRALASDDYVIQAAQVSSKGENNPETVPARLIEALMRGRHGSPFEHNSFTFFVEAPIFVLREWQRHRISSFNEMSGRYTQLRPKFYIPSLKRKTVNIGTSMKPVFSHDLQSNLLVHKTLEANATVSWQEYQKLLNAGISNEVARMVLPLNIYSQMYWTVNARSLMNFLSLRINSEESLVRSYPQLEIQMGAEKVEEAFKEYMPITAGLFNSLGRVAP